jgi:hypothetical protein
MGFNQHSQTFMDLFKSLLGLFWEIILLAGVIIVIIKVWKAKF